MKLIVSAHSNICEDWNTVKKEMVTNRKDVPWGWFGMTRLRLIWMCNLD